MEHWMNVIQNFSERSASNQRTGEDALYSDPEEMVGGLHLQRQWLLRHTLIGAMKRTVMDDE
jgi:hypothetical protein